MVFTSIPLTASQANRNALLQVIAERKRQDDKWGPDRWLSPERWMTILTEEVGEVAKEVLEGNTPKLEAELIQVAAVAVAMIEAINEARL